MDSNIVEIEKNAFYMCHELQNIHLPKTLITIGDYAFAGCSKLSSIVLPEGLQKISQFAFLDCENLSKICFPSILKVNNELKKAVLIIRGSKKYDEQELENNPVEEEIIRFYMNVINNEVLLPDDKEDIKTKLLNFLEQKLLLLHQNVDGISVDVLLNSIHSYISDRQKNLIKYIPEQIEYSQAIGGQKK